MLISFRKDYDSFIYYLSLRGGTPTRQSLYDNSYNLVCLIEVICVLVNNSNFTRTYKTLYPAIKPTFCHPRKDPLDYLFTKEVPIMILIREQGILTRMTK